MKTIIILDQIQAGLGGDERSDTPLGGKKIAMGSADNVEKALEAVHGEIIGTFYCGPKYYQQNKDIVQRKFSKMAEKMKTDVVIVGPAFDYHDFAEMAVEIGIAITENTSIPVIGAIAKEKNQELIEKYKDRFPIVKMPKKGGTGLAESLDNLAKGCQILTNKEDISKFKGSCCYYFFSWRL